MLRNPVTSIALVSLLAISAGTTCLLSLRWLVSVQELQRLQARSEFLTRTSTALQQLATEAMEYGRRDPSIVPVLQQLSPKSATPGASISNAPPLAPLPALTPQR